MLGLRGGAVMRVLVIHNGDDRGRTLAARVRALGHDVQEELAVWPTFFQAVHQPHTVGSFHRNPNEQPEVVVIEGAGNPGVGRECAGYLGETAFTRHIPVYLVDHPQDQMARAKRRAPHAHLVTTGQLEQRLSTTGSPTGEQPVA